MQVPREGLEALVENRAGADRGGLGEPRQGSTTSPAALRALEATGLTCSEAIRTALVDDVRHRRRSPELVAEVAALEVR